jgi:hypothetical protein
MGYKDTPATHTLSVSYLTGIPGGGIQARAQTFNWNQLEGFVELSDFYQYFTPLSYKLDISPAIDLTDNTLVVALQPHNYIVESVPSTVSFTTGTLATMRGHVTFQVGSNNRGNWSSWPALTQQLNSIDSLSQPAGLILTACDLTSTGSFSVVVSVTCRFFRRSPFNSLSLRGAPVQIAPSHMIKQQLDSHAALDPVPSVDDD